MAGIVIVGAGQAGSALAARLRGLGHDGPITLIGEEPVPPYQRPPLSKAYLLGDMALERLFLRPRKFYDDHRIDLRLGARVTAIDPDAGTLALAGDSIAFDSLALTTGAAPRRLPAAAGGDLAGVHVLRDLADADRLAPEFAPGLRLVVVGGGYIGLEAAAVGIARGMHVTLIEAAPRILGRVASAKTADWFRALHSARGVHVIEGTAIDRLLGDAGRVRAVQLDSGRELPADVVVVGIGVTPRVDLAQAAGITCDNGIMVDARGRTSHPRVWAAGDCANLIWRGRRLRLESVQNAIDQAECVAADMLGQGQDYDPVPWFWSDQYEVKLQIAGLGQGHDLIMERPGAGGSVSFWYFAQGRLIAVDAMNDPRAFMIGKRLLEAGRSPEPGLLADPSTNLRGLLA